MKKLVLLAVFVTLSTACVGNQYSVPGPEYDPAMYEAVGSGTEQATGVMLFQIIPIGQNDKFERAAKKLMEDRGGDLLVDLKVKEKWFWAYVLNMYKTEVSGTVLRKK